MGKKILDNEIIDKEFVDNEINKIIKETIKQMEQSCDIILKPKYVSEAIILLYDKKIQNKVINDILPHVYYRFPNEDNELDDFYKSIEQSILNHPNWKNNYKINFHSVVYLNYIEGVMLHHLFLARIKGY